MKIVHLFKDFDPPVRAGITRYVRDIADAAANAGHDVEVHVAGVRASRREILPSGVIVHRHRELGRALSSPLSPGLALASARAEADALHVHSPNPVAEAGAVKNAAALIVSFHAQLGRQSFVEPVYAPLRRRLLHRAHAVIVSNDPMAHTPEVAPFEAKLHVLPYGISPRVRSGSRPERATADSALRLIFVGRLVYYKGLDVLLDATARVREATLTIVGDGPLREELVDLARAPDLREKVRFTGPVDDDSLAALFDEHDVFVMPSVSKAEAFGMAMSEAMAHGLPAISTALGTGTDWVNVDGETGIVVPPGDARALAVAIDALADQELRTRLGDGAATRAAREFSFDRHLADLLRLYEAAAGTR